MKVTLFFGSLIANHVLVITCPHRKVRVDLIMPVLTT